MGEMSSPLVRRGRRNARYTAISNFIIDHPELSPEARIALIYLLSKPDYWRLQINDIRRLLGTAGKPCGRNKAYEVIKELKASAYILAYEVLDEGRFSSITYFVFDEPLEDPEGFKAELRREGSADRSGAQIEVEDTDSSPCAEIRDTAPSPHPGFRDPEKGDSTKNRRKQTTEPPPPSPSVRVAAGVAPPEGGDFGFLGFWTAWPEATRPRQRGLAAKLFAALSPDDKRRTIDWASRFRAAQAHRGVFVGMIPYLRERRFLEFDDAPPFTSDGYFRITPERPEWSAWADHFRRTLSPATYAKQQALGYLLARTRWPDAGSDKVASGQLVLDGSALSPNAPTVGPRKVRRSIEDRRVSPQGLP